MFVGGKFVNGNTFSLSHSKRKKSITLPFYHSTITLPLSHQMTTKRSTHYVFTINNYTDNDIGLLKPFYEDYCKYLVYGKEVGEKELSPHLQGFFTLKTKLYMTGVHKALGSKKIALQPANGTSLQASNYCKKPKKSGNPPKKLDPTSVSTIKVKSLV
ncbi:expressed unknown protein [Seminavis robusta]|uniref:CRESS-DNA virus Rep endonuclease domain-containing protein n=1 Tax=Seminavis robusta TaxID=568900 RepID=A0A9N8ECU8_9STRA|nr:expressed unknown protein [Seminavis robusta]|eukprot:Sro937_g222150.1 n/a (158) ;mRNA; f:1885-2358